MKKNCNNCENLEWGFGDVNDPEGWVCNRRDFYGPDEKKMLDNMERDEYREKAKVCFVPRVQTDCTKSNDSA